MADLAEKFADDVERECKVIQFTLPDHEETLGRLAEMHRREAARLEGAISGTRKEMKKTIADFNAEIARLQKQIEDVKAGAAAKIAADQKTLRAIRAFLAEAEAES